MVGSGRWRLLRHGLAALMIVAGATVPGSGAGATAPVPGSLPALAGTGVATDEHETGTYDFTAGWRFALVNAAEATDPTGAYANAQDPGFDDAAWRPVHLPHDWSIELNPTAGPGTNTGTGYYQGGLGWYRKSFTLPAGLAGRQLSLEFDGVYMDAAVYLNGAPIGEHHYGYTGFAVDLTGAHTDGRTADVLAVRVRNQVPSSRWYPGSGIYRNVRLVATGPVHVQRLGMQVTAPGLAGTVAAGYADVHVATTVAGPVGAVVGVTSVVRDARGREAGRATGSVTVAEGRATADLDVRVPRPHLWSVADPYLYRVTTELTVAGRVVDAYATRTGLRWTRFDPQRGFFLNGEPAKLRGVNLHHDLGALGAAVNGDALVRQLRIMQSMGVNAVRTAHNPPSPELIQACDRLGLLLVVEAFDVWRVAKVRYDYARFFDADSDADIAEMVRQARNSPAVVMWSIGNEIPGSTQAAGVPIARRLIDDVRALDPTRPVVIGSDRYRSVPAAGSAAEQILLMLDGVGLNYNTAASIDALHSRYPNTFFFESESSSETSARGEYNQPEQLNTGEDHTPGGRAASSYDNNLESWTMSGEYALKKDRDRPWFLGQFLWSGIDYLGEPTPFAVFPVKASFFGAVDTAGLPKDQYYLFRSQWTDRPMVHLLPMDWTDRRPGEPVQVWAYTNADTVELYLDGRSLGVRRFDHKVTADGRAYLETTEPTGDDKTVTSGPFPGSYTGTDGTAGHLHLTWTVPYRPGRLVAVARRGGAEVARDEIATAGAAAAVRLSADRRTVPADGRSLAFVTAEVVDRRGVVVPGAADLLRFEVRNGRLVGVDNGRQESAESFKAPYRTAFHGKAVAVVTPDAPGAMRVTATAAGLAGGSVTLPVLAAAPPDGSQGRAPVSWSTPDAPTAPVPPATGDVRADAGFSGSEATPPAAMVDGDPATSWSNAYTQPATPLLPEVAAARPGDWVSLSWTPERTVSGITASFTLDARNALPAAITVSYRDGGRWRPVPDATIDWATGPGQATTIGFPPIRAAAVRLALTSAHPGQRDGSVAIAELAVG